MKRREVKGKEEKERYTHLNAEFQRIVERDKKAFLSDQCKEIEVSTHSEILFSLKKEGKPAICNNTEEPRGHYVK